MQNERQVMDFEQIKRHRARSFLPSGIAWLALLALGCSSAPIAAPKYTPRQVREDLKRISTKIGRPVQTSEPLRVAAISDLDAILAEEPLNYPARWKRAELLVTWDLPDTAIADLERLESDYGRTDSLLALRGKAHYQAGRRRSAMESFEAALEEHPRNPRALMHLGILLSEEGRFEEAARYFQRVIEIRPDHSTARNLMERIGSDGGGNDGLEPLSAVDPYDLEIAGNILLRASRPSRAVELLLEALRARPKDPELLEAAADGFLQLDEPETASELLRRRVALDPSVAALHLRLAAAYARAAPAEGRFYVLAAESFEAAARLDPDASGPLQGAAGMRAAAGDVETAQAHFEVALALDPPAEFFLDYGRFLAGTVGADAAAEAYRQGLAAAPEHADLLAHLMATFFEEYRFDEAQKARRQLEALASLTPGARALMDSYSGVGP